MAWYRQGEMIGPRTQSLGMLLEGRGERGCWGEEERVRERKGASVWRGDISNK